MKTYFNALSLIFLFCQFSISVNAQRLPSVQKAGLWAPDNIKIDGKTTEWDKFKAYNSVNHLFYTIANDDKNLYLIVQSSNGLAIQKITRWGIALTVNSLDKKKTNDPNNVSVSFPINYDKNGIGIIKGATPYYRSKHISINSDSLKKALNAKIAIAFKLIQVAGIKKLNESVISVYNTDGIKAAALFDDKMAYTYELAVPLKYLDIKINSRARFSYNIKLNGGVINNMAPTKIRSDGRGNPDRDYLFSPTDFWGEYTLVMR